jgi:uncharacterized protein
MSSEYPQSDTILPEPLTSAEKQTLLGLARRSIEAAVIRMRSQEIQLEDYSDHLQAPGASFVTLTKYDALRGCIGALEAYQPLVQDVCEHAVAAALDDYRFPPVEPDEVSHLHIEISRLTKPQPLVYSAPEELLVKLRPDIDGVTLFDGARRATFLPQVWEKIPDHAEFLSHLCQKMGSSANLWRKKVLTVYTYQVEEFHE